MCLSTDIITDLVICELEEAATKVAVLNGTGDLSQFVLDYLRVAVDWKHVADTLQSRAVENGG